MLGKIERWLTNRKERKLLDEWWERKNITINKESVDDLVKGKLKK